MSFILTLLVHIPPPAGPAAATRCWYRFFPCLLVLFLLPAPPHARAQNGDGSETQSWTISNTNLRDVQTMASFFGRPRRPAITTNDIHGTDNPFRFEIIPSATLFDGDAAGFTIGILRDYLETTRYRPFEVRLGYVRSFSDGLGKNDFVHLSARISPWPGCLHSKKNACDRFDQVINTFISIGASYLGNPLEPIREDLFATIDQELDPVGMYVLGGGIGGIYEKFSDGHEIYPAVSARFTFTPSQSFSISADYVHPFHEHINGNYAVSLDYVVVDIDQLMPITISAGVGKHDVGKRDLGDHYVFANVTIGRRFKHR